jgi:probable addiction module antidote protein
LAEEAFCVLIRRDKAQRTMPKARLGEFLVDQAVRIHFLKLCLEFDDTPRLDKFRAGLLLAVQAMGTTAVAKATKINRVTLYRMLAKGGNPSLENLIRIVQALGVRLWVVDEEFFARRQPVVRPKDVGQAAVHRISKGQIATIRRRT